MSIEESTPPIATASRRAWLAVLSVAVGSFTLVTNEFLPVGLLSDVAADLHVSEATAGTMITAPGIIAAVSALALPVLFQRIDRRAALLGLSLTFVLADVLAGLAPNFPVLLAARALLGIGIGGFWAIAVGVGTRLVPQQLGQQATSLIFGGISIGTVVGVPAGPLLGNQFGWRAAFLIVAALGLLPVILQAIFLPRLAVAKAVTLRSFGALLSSSRARVALLMTLLTITAQFAAYTFVAPFLQQRTGASPTLISALLLVFAAAGILGNFAAAPALARALRPTVLCVLAVLALSQLLMPVFGTWTAGAFIVIAVWGLAYGAVPVALQTWLFHADPRAANENGSGMFVAIFQSSIAIGSLIGAVMVDASGTRAAMYAGAVLATAALALTAFVANNAGAQTPVRQHQSDQL
ncbi:MFS transporter [Streptomyces sp. SID13031]|uniref:MFS transporter n=1 Tax=Streptomyces sp. SID13031 TaxID=2706046 RepID=UPI0013CD7E5E|nr:MFS transporter [Streptomyces sp. SID13031]NEA31094.1 MFS transporter [Streptomyces sp. SID13031]